MARLWSTALAGKVDIGYIKATGHSVKIYLPQTAMKPEVEFEWKIPKWSNAIKDSFARADLVASLLLLCGLHPVPLETRVTQALNKVRPYLDSHGGNVELLGIIDEVVHLRLQGSCRSCPSSSMTLKLAIEEAIHAAAPDVVAIEAEGVLEQPAPLPGGLVQIGKSQGNGGGAQAKHPTVG
jgi:Fe-S cluster biogenesis protein NfuA